MSGLIEAAIELEDRIQRLETLLEAFDSLAGDNTPSWLHIVREEVQAINVALEPVSKLARVQP